MGGAPTSPDRTGDARDGAPDDSRPGPDRPGLDEADAADDPTMSIDDQFRALLEGLRTSIPAVQVLFAFLLTAPLQTDFDRLDDLERLSFAVAFYASGIGSILLVAPSAHQRVRAPISGIERHSARHLLWATWIAIVGSAAVLVAVSATVFLVTSIVFGPGAAAIAATAMAMLACWSWLVVPTFHFRTRRSH